MVTIKVIETGFLITETGLGNKQYHASTWKEACNQLKELLPICKQCGYHEQDMGLCYECREKRDKKQG